MLRKSVFILLCLGLCLVQNAFAAPEYPFPHSVKYAHGIKPSISQEAMNADVQTAYENWLTRYITSEGCPAGAYRVHRDGVYDDDTVSEGIAWGMLITVLMDNPENQSKKYFDGFWAYYKHYRNKNGLMSWKVNKKGKIIGKDSATDADEDAVLALMYAYKQWGTAEDLFYLQEARELVHSVFSHEVEAKSYVIKPGSEWGGNSITNPSYYAPAYYRAWSYFNIEWAKVTERSYRLYDIFYDKLDTGLYPDWCVAEGSPSYRGYDYTYDACRVPLRIGLDHLWNGQSEKYLDKLTYWMVKKTDAKPQAIMDGYKLDGTTIGRYNNAAFVGPICVAAMVSPKYQYWLDLLYQHLAGMETGGMWGYYPDTIRLFSLIILSGNMPNLWEISEPQPSSG